MITDDELNAIPVREIVEASDTLARISDFVAEGARYVCHVHTTSVPTAYRVLGNFYTGLYSMKDAADYMVNNLGNAENLRHVNGGDADAEIEEAQKYLIESQYHLHEAAKKFEAAQQKLAWVGHHDPLPEAFVDGLVEGAMIAHEMNKQTD